MLWEQGGSTSRLCLCESVIVVKLGLEEGIGKGGDEGIEFSKDLVCVGNGKKVRVTLRNVHIVRA